MWRPVSSIRPCPPDTHSERNAVEAKRNESLLRPTPLGQLGSLVLQLPYAKADPAVVLGRFQREGVGWAMDDRSNAELRNRRRRLADLGQLAPDENERMFRKHSRAPTTTSEPYWVA